MPSCHYTPCRPHGQEVKPLQQASPTLQRHLARHHLQALSSIAKHPPDCSPYVRSQEGSQPGARTRLNPTMRTRPGTTNSTPRRRRPSPSREPTPPSHLRAARWPPGAESGQILPEAIPARSLPRTAPPGPPRSRHQPAAPRTTLLPDVVARSRPTRRHGPEHGRASTRQEAPHHPH